MTETMKQDVQDTHSRKQHISFVNKRLGLVSSMITDITVTQSVSVRGVTWDS